MTTARELGRIETVDDIREYWPNEARDFTPWLAKNISLLGDALGMDLESRKQEASVGPFSLDILARDLDTNRPVAIENQFGTTDHRHLGQLLTYATGTKADVVVWIAEEFQDEHRAALDYLNQRTDEATEFFGVAVELFQIDDSRAAPHFKLVATPNDWSKHTSRNSQVSANVSERNERYRSFFQYLIDILRDEHKFTNARKARPNHWRRFASGYSGISYGASFTSEQAARVELYTNRENKDWNVSLLQSLEAQTESISHALAETPIWETLDKACRVSVVRHGSIDDDDETLEEVREWMVDRLLKFKEVFGPRLAELVD